MQDLYSMGQVARLVGVPQHRIAYAISSGHLDEAQLFFLRKRCFTSTDLRKIAKYFGVSVPRRGGNV